MCMMMRNSLEELQMQLDFIKMRYYVSWRIMEYMQRKIVSHEVEKILWKGLNRKKIDYFLAKQHLVDNTRIQKLYLSFSCNSKININTKQKSQNRFMN